MAKRSVTSQEETKPADSVPTGTDSARPIGLPPNATESSPGSGGAAARSSPTDCRIIEDCLARPKREFDFEAWLKSEEPDMKNQAAVPGDSKGSSRYAWIGVGQCGGRLAKSFYDLGNKKVLAVDTTGEDLDALGLPDNQKCLLQINQDDGPSGDVEAARRAIQHRRADILHLIKQTFETEVDRIMVCFGAGGRAGGGSVVELIELAKKYAQYAGLKKPSKRVGVLMTLPTAAQARCPQVAETAHAVATAVGRMAAAGDISPLVIVDNDRINALYPGVTGPSFWPSINTSVASLFDSFNRLSRLSSPYTCFDPADYDCIMDAGGCLIMGAAEVDRLDDTLAISRAVEHSIQRTLCIGGEDISKAKVAGCIVTGGKELMAHVKSLQDNIDYAFDVLSEVTGQATIYRGIYEDSMDGLAVYTVIGGLGCPTARLEKIRMASCTAPNRVDTEGLPLQERRDDILPLAESFLAKCARAEGKPDKTLNSEARIILFNYSWPENIPELTDAIRHAFEVTEGPEIQADALPFAILFADPEFYSDRALTTLDSVKRRVSSKAYDEFLQRLT
ncbi:MAG TPA: hypothetical protein VMW24_19645 [Sedimentisphaerales bacterium]|nr:hypothetical protein [Sedimentisphaerales bacterium]